MIKLHIYDKPIHLNIGCGNNPKSENGIHWINIDTRKLPKVDYIMDAQKLEFEKESFNLVYASHILEHFSHKKTEEIVRGWYGGLKKGGVMKIAVPDMLEISKAFAQGSVGADQVMLYYYGGQGYEDNFHQAGFCFVTLKRLMRKIGLKDIKTWDRDRSDASGSLYSLNLQGIK